MTDLIWSFSPWLAFLLGTRVTSLYGAVAAGVAVAAVVAIRAMARRRMHLLDAAGLCYFLALGAVLVTVHPGHLESGPGTPRPARIALTVIVFGSDLIGHPFTESYARHTAPAAVCTPPPRDQPAHLRGMGAGVSGRDHLLAHRRQRRRPPGPAPGDRPLRRPVPGLPVHPEADQASARRYPSR